MNRTDGGRKRSRAVLGSGPTGYSNRRLPREGQPADPARQSVIRNTPRVVLVNVKTAGELPDERDAFRNAPLARIQRGRALSARIGKRFSATQVVWNKSNRCGGERGGARVGRHRWVRILIITGGTSAVFNVDVQDPFE
jgi:hypothetical protein